LNIVGKTGVSVSWPQFRLHLGSSGLWKRNLQAERKGKKEPGCWPAGQTYPV